MTLFSRVTLWLVMLPIHIVTLLAYGAENSTPSWDDLAWPDIALSIAIYVATWLTVWLLVR